jgi:cytoplasmic iron level regulating protein YaaA (DUF328/UPF0246 family)
LIEKALELDQYLKSLSPQQVAKSMHLSSTLTDKTYALIQNWTANPANQSQAIDTFIGDIYSGLHAGDLSPADRDYAEKTLFILSGLYGCIRPYDGILPYRLEMGYKLPIKKVADLYKFWGNSIVNCLPTDGLITNLAAVEYSRTVTPFVDPTRVITPHFLTENPKNGKPTFVVVHAKIARGAFARWLLTERVDDKESLSRFSELGYVYNKELSETNKPTFICKEFKGKGRSIRLL